MSYDDDQDDIIELARENDTLRNERDEARRDTTRLDWLDAHPDRTLDQVSDIWCCAGESEEAPDNCQGITVREAIDSAQQWAAMQGRDGGLR